MSGPGESAMFRRLLGLMMAPGEKRPWVEILPHEWHTPAAATYFLLDYDAKAENQFVQSFVCITLRRLLQQLTRRTEQQRVTYRGQVRGRIHWASTYKARYTQDYDPTRFVCQEVRRQYDTPENQLVKYMVHQIRKCLELVPDVLRQGACYYSNGHDLPQNHGATDARLRDIEEELNNSRVRSRLRDITLPQNIDESYLVRAETSRTEEYAEVAHLYRCYRRTVLSLSWNEIAGIGRRVLPLPQRTGRDEDRWIRLGVSILQAQRESR